MTDRALQHVENLALDRRRVAVWNPDRAVVPAVDAMSRGRDDRTDGPKFRAVDGGAVIDADLPRVGLGLPALSQVEGRINGAARPASQEISQEKPRCS